MTEIKPCPFCGGRGFVESETGPTRRIEWVECISCGATGRWHRASRSHGPAIRDWNRRVEE